MSIEILKETVDKKEAEYAPVPFWSWNDELQPEELRRQMDWMRQNGMGGAFMHARGGLKTEYLSRDWMQCVQTCGDHGRKIGFDAWIYDENGWPSGFAGGKLLADAENRDCFLTHTEGAYDAAAAVSYLITEEELVRVADGKAAGSYLNVFVHTAASTADILNPAVVDKFIALTHEAYKKHFGADFAKKFRGFFTDEPQYFRWATPYTHVLESAFRERYQADVLDGLGLLFVQKRGYRTFRYRYWKTMQELMLRAFAEKTYRWCDENGVQLTGHYVQEDGLGPQMTCCAGIMPFYEFEHIPGIDWLGPYTDNELGVRQVASAAAQLGKKRILTESFGCCGWNITPWDLKRIVDFQFVGGVNLLCQHLLPYAEYGQRKRDYPAHYSAANPWVHRDFAAFNTYAARLGCLIGESTEAVRVAVLHPIRSVYFDYSREVGNGDNALPQVEKTFLRDLRSLSSRGIGYHFLDETLLARHGFVADNYIGCGKLRYDYLVLPHILTMDASTERLLRQYVQNGGKVLLLGEKPTYVEDLPQDYAYLQSNCTLKEIAAAQPMRMAETKTDIYTTYRVLNGQPFVFALNASQTNTYTQTFDLGAAVQSFVRVDLNDYSEKNVGLTLTLEPGESALLLPQAAAAMPEPERTVLRFCPKNAPVTFAENYLAVDCVRYSTDGVHYSKEYPCMGLFAHLLELRYEGPLWLQYAFEVRALPKAAVLKAEDCGKAEHFLNGRPFDFTGCSPVESHLLTADIASLLREGKNTYTVRRNWFQSEKVYYALFGENVTESLKNCLVYDSDLEAVYIAGQFGVYSDQPFVPDKKEERYIFGGKCYIGAVPDAVTEPVTDGFPFFAGSLTMTQTVTLDRREALLRVDGTQLEAFVRVNGKPAGKLLLNKTLDISHCTVIGENKIEVELVIGNHNLLGPHHCKDKGHRKFIAPDSFELAGTWQNGKSPRYRERYEWMKLNLH